MNNIIKSIIKKSELYNCSSDILDFDFVKESTEELATDIKSGLLTTLSSQEFIDNVCLSYRHDFGLMSEEEKRQTRYHCKLWLNAIENNLMSIL